MLIAWKNGCVLEESAADKTVAIVGLATGVELACKLADRLGERGRFRLIELTDKSCGHLQFNLQQLVKPWKRGVFGLI